MTPVSRPLRALCAVLGGWTAMRVVALWPVNGAVVAVPSIDVARAASASAVAAMLLDKGVPLVVRKPLSNPVTSAIQPKQGTAVGRQIATLTVGVTNADQPQDIARVPETDALVAIRTAIAPGFPGAATRNRFSGSAWSLMRGDGAPSFASGGQLGGSQMGMRIFYTPGPAALAITARISAPLSQPAGREASIGLALRGRNVGLIAEQRFALDKGGRDAPAVFAYGGVSDVKLGGGLRLDGYTQAGVVGLKDPVAFIDGAIRIERTVLTFAKSSLAIGAGAWGGAQPQTARIDIGPQIVAHLALAEASLRVSAEWRQRAAGNAAPASGPSVTVGFDF